MQEGAFFILKKLFRRAFEWSFSLERGSWLSHEPNFRNEGRAKRFLKICFGLKKGFCHGREAYFVLRKVFQRGFAGC